MKFTKKKSKTIIDEGNKEKGEENTPSQEDVEAAKDMLAAMMGPPEEEMPSTFMLYGDVNEERASDIVSALLLLVQACLEVLQMLHQRRAPDLESVV